MILVDFSKFFNVALQTKKFERVGEREEGGLKSQSGTSRRGIFTNLSNIYHIIFSENSY